MWASQDSCGDVTVAGARHGMDEGTGWVGWDKTLWLLERHGIGEVVCAMDMATREGGGKTFTNQHVEIDQINKGVHTGTYTTSFYHDLVSRWHT